MHSTKSKKHECVNRFFVQNFGFHLGLIMHRKYDVIYEIGQIYDVISHFVFNGIDPSNHPRCSITLNYDHISSLVGK